MSGRRKSHRMRGNVLFVVISLVALVVVVMRPPSEEREIVAQDIVSICRQVAQAQEIYYEEDGGYGTLKELADKRLIDAGLARDPSKGYHFEMEVSEDGLDWCMRTWPVKPGLDTKSYYVDATGELRIESYRRESDEKAGPDSPLLWEEEDWDFSGD